MGFHQENSPQDIFLVILEKLKNTEIRVVFFRDLSKALDCILLNFFIAFLKENFGFYFILKSRKKTGLVFRDSPNILSGILQTCVSFLL